MFPFNFNLLLILWGIIIILSAKNKTYLSASARLWEKLYGEKFVQISHFITGIISIILGILLIIENIGN